MDTTFVGGYIAGAVAISYGVWVAWRLWDRPDVHHRSDRQRWRNPVCNCGRTHPGPKR